MSAPKKPPPAESTIIRVLTLAEMEAIWDRYLLEALEELAAEVQARRARRLN